MKTSQVNHLSLSLVRMAMLYILTFGLRVSAEDWPQFRGPTGQGVSQATRLPITWDTTNGVSWCRPIVGKGWSSPVVYDGCIFLTTAVPMDESGEEQSLRAICIKAATGTEVWQREVFRPRVTPEMSIHAKNSFASPTPVVHRGKLYVHFGPIGTAALDLDGNILWVNNSIRYEARHGGGGSPIVSGDLLIFNCDGVESPFVVAISLESGDVRWRTNRPAIEPERFSFSTPLEIAVASRRQIVSSGSSFVCSYDPESGTELWRVAYPRKWSVIPRPLYAHDLVYICTGYEGPAELLAIRPDGRGDVTETHVSWRIDENVPHTSSPILVGDELFMISDNGIASCRNAKTGRLYWRKRLGGDFSASPLYAEGRLYFTSEDGLCSVLAANREFEKITENDLSEPTLASFAVVDDALLIRTAENLYRIEATSSDPP